MQPAKPSSVDGPTDWHSVAEEPADTRGKIMGLQATGRDRIMRGVRNQEAFTLGNVRGEWFNQPADIERGQLPRDTELPSCGPVFVVFSYRTPIAWWHGGTWSLPAIKYSVTTTNHQRVTAQAIAQSVGA